MFSHDFIQVLHFTWVRNDCWVSFCWEGISQQKWTQQWFLPKELVTFLHDHNFGFKNLNWFWCEENDPNFFYKFSCKYLVCLKTSVEPVNCAAICRPTCYLSDLLWQIQLFFFFKKRIFIFFVCVRRFLNGTFLLWLSKPWSLSLLIKNSRST